MALGVEAPGFFVDPLPVGQNGLLLREVALIGRHKADGAVQMPGVVPANELLHSAAEAYDWFLGMMREHEEFEVVTDEAGELALGFWSETVRRVLVGPRPLTCGALIGSAL